MINDIIDEPKTLYIPDQHVWRRGVVLCYVGTLSSRPDTTLINREDGASLWFIGIFISSMSTLLTIVLI
jgi:hypothetical protein